MNQPLPCSAASLTSNSLAGLLTTVCKGIRRSAIAKIANENERGSNYPARASNINSHKSPLSKLEARRDLDLRRSSFKRYRSAENQPISFQYNNVRFHASSSLGNNRSSFTANPELQSVLRELHGSKNGY